MLPYSLEYFLGIKEFKNEVGDEDDEEEVDDSEEEENETKKKSKPKNKK